MAYKYTTGSVFRGDIYSEDDAGSNTYLDWNQDALGVVAGGTTVMVFSGSDHGPHVGVATTSPDATLHVSASDPTPTHFMVSSPSWTTSNANPESTEDLTGVLLKITGSGIVFGETNTYFDFGQVQIGAADSGYGRLELGTGSVNDSTARLHRLIHVNDTDEFHIYNCQGSTNQQVFELDGTTLEAFGTCKRPGGGSWTDSTSDVRLKKNIETLTGSLAKIIQLEGRSYDWKNPECHGGVSSAAGFIAQEIQSVFPEFVSEAKLRDEKEIELISEGAALTYGLPNAFMAHLVEAIKEQQSTIETLLQRVQQLEDDSTA